MDGREGDEGGRKEKESKGNAEEKVKGKQEIRWKGVMMEGKPVPVLLLFLIPVYVLGFFTVV